MIHALIKVPVTTLILPGIGIFLGVTETCHNTNEFDMKIFKVFCIDI